MNEQLSQFVQSLGRFWQIVVDVWQQGFLGISVGQLVGAAVVFLLFVAIRQVIGHLVIGALRRLAKRTSLRFDDAIVVALDAPARFIPVIVGAFLAYEILDVSGTFGELAYRVIRSFVTFAIFWGLYNLVEPLSDALRHLEGVFTSVMVDWLVKAIRAAVLFIGAATILQVWGVAVGPILAGLGLVGVAVALGAQDLFKNLIAGILILVEKRFGHGDWIRVDGVVEGTVETVGFRSSLIRQFDKAPVFVPNAKLADSPVANYTRMTHRRIYWRIGVLYSTSVEQLRAIRDGIESYVLDSDEFSKPPETVTFVRIDQFGESSIDILLYCFTKTTAWGEWLEIKERLALRIKEIVEGAGSGFAFPSRSIYIESPGDENAEVFVPPGEGAGRS